MLDKPEETADRWSPTPVSPKAPARENIRHSDFPAGQPERRDENVAPPASEGKGRSIRLIATLTVLAVLVAGGYGYWWYRSLYPVTTDAYVNANVARLAPQIGGQVLRVLVADNQHVVKGQRLVEIDPAPYKIAVEQADARLELAKQEAGAAASAANAARALVVQREAELEDVAANTSRMLDLVGKGTLPEASGDDARAALKEAQATRDAANADLQRAIHEMGTPGERNASIRAAEAALDKAKLDLSYTQITAPADGIVGHVVIRPGTTVESGESLFPLVEDDSYWVDANYKETDLARIKPGQSASVAVDIYSDKTFRGVVESVSPASGAAFSLLPPEDATGNWVKVTQRFPVRVRILDSDPAHPLRIGASSVVTIDTTSNGDSSR